MKISNIENIKDYGIFSDYTRSYTKPFGNNNIIYGWNYSGKTTISRIFRSLEIGEIQEGFENGKFNLMLDNNKSITQEDIYIEKLNIRVFNSDYIRSNLSWERQIGGIPSILVVGEQNIKLQEKLEQLQTGNKELIERKEKAIKNKNAIEIEIDTALTNEAARITKELALTGRSFERPHLKTLIEEIFTLSWLKEDSNASRWFLADDIFQQTKTTAQSTDKRETIEEITCKPDTSLLEAVNALLQKDVTPSKTIYRLKQNSSIENWVREGRTLHKGKKICEFCQNKLPAGLLSELDSHFSKEYEEFRKEVEEFQTALERKKLNINLKIKNEFYSDLQSIYISTKDKLGEEINKYNHTIDILNKSVKDKLNHLSEQMSLDPMIKLNIEAIEMKVTQFNEIIKKNNIKTTNFDVLKKKAIETLKKHYASLFYQERKIAEKEKEKKELYDLARSINKEIELKDKEIKEIEAQLSESIRGSEILNDFIKCYFGTNTPIEIRVIDNRFHILRQEKEAKNLSEGEKTAISFSYFLTTLNDKETKNKLKETIIYIDDPISSLDSNHLYNTYALIASYLKNKCAQLFISTHNYEFFNLLKDEFFSYTAKKGKDCFASKNNDNCKAHIYQVERTHDNATISNIDCLLCNFKSEYQFVFYQLYQFYKNPDADDKYKLYTIPNLLRRFFETYLSFYYPTGKAITDHLDKLIYSADARIKVHKIVDEFSHSENTERVLKIPPPIEIMEAIDITFKAFENDPARNAYLIELKKSVGISDEVEGAVFE